MNSPMGFYWFSSWKCPARPTVPLIFYWSDDCWLNIPPVKVLWYLYSFQFIEWSIGLSSELLSYSSVIASCLFEFLWGSICESIYTHFIWPIFRIMFHNFFEVPWENQLSHDQFIRRINFTEIFSILWKSVILKVNGIYCNKENE